MKHLLVKATKSGGRVVIFERDKAHPGGELFIYADDGKRTHKAGNTAAVQALLDDGSLAGVATPVAPKPKLKRPSKRKSTDG